MDIIQSLMQFGLGRQEAVLYLSLLENGDLNGYELAKKTGISRSNTYSGLAGLVEKGAAWSLEGETVRYRAVPGSEFTDNRIRYWTGLRKELVSSLPSRREKSGSYITIRGKQAILDRMHNLIVGTRERLYLSQRRDLIETVIGELVSIHDRGCRITALSDAEGCALVETACLGAVTHRSDPAPGQIRLIVDSHHVLTGDISGPGEASCLYSDHPNLVELFKSSLRNEIRLSQLKDTNQSINEDIQ